MVKNLMIILLIAALVVIPQILMYRRGRVDGEFIYKQSRRMHLALQSAYHFGFMDCKQGLKENFNGEDE